MTKIHTQKVQSKNLNFNIRFFAVVNAAAVGSGYLGRGYEPWDITPEEWDTVTDINFKAAFFLICNEIDYMLSKEKYTAIF